MKGWSTLGFITVHSVVKQRGGDGVRCLRDEEDKRKRQPFRNCCVL